MGDGRRRFARMRSILEVPILNERFWSKVPHSAADAIMIDLEDSAIPARKAEARAAAVGWLGRPDYFGGRTVIVRVNNVSTPWAADDLEAMARAPGDFLLCYPKAQTPEEIRDVQNLLSRAGSPPRDLHVMIETPRALVELDRIAALDGIAGLHFGYVDLAAEMGSRPFDDQGLFEDSAAYPRARIATAGAAFGHFVTGGSLIPDYKNLAKVRRLVESWRDAGFTACIAVSPAHVELINEVMSPSADQLDMAKRVCQSYEQAVSCGDPAAVLDDRVITLPDYRVAALVLERAGYAVPTPR
jgi:citrate lyase beta subunit